MICAALLFTSMKIVGDTIVLFSFEITLTRCWNISAHQRSLNRLAVPFVDSDEGSEGAAHS